MARFLIEVPHSAGREECARAVHFFLDTASHFMTRTEWGCRDGVHKGWTIVEADSKDDALKMVPLTFRAQAEVTGLNRFTMDEINEILREHTG
jgi:hypothetical protein